MAFLGPLHRYTYGIGWKGTSYCSHPDHRGSFGAPKRRRKKEKNPLSMNRIAPLHLIRNLAQFPIGGRLCATHLKQIYSTIREQESAAEDLNAISDIYSYGIDNHSYGADVHSYGTGIDNTEQLNNTNRLLDLLNQSPIKSQAIIPLEDQTLGAIRRQTAKLRRIVSVAGNIFKYSLVSFL